jgi:hypothetical protein
MHKSLSLCLNKTAMKLASIFGLLIIFSFLSCNPKPGCTDLRAENYDPSAEKDNGECVLQREKFLGAYIGTSAGCNLISAEYETTIREANDNLTDVIIENLGGVVQKDLRATISGNNITIDENKNAPDGEYVNGTGIIIGNLINIELRYRIGGGSTTICQLEMQK